jgi:hypothetical protein
MASIIFLSLLLKKEIERNRHLKTLDPPKFQGLAPNKKRVRRFVQHAWQERTRENV